MPNGSVDNNHPLLTVKLSMLTLLNHPRLNNSPTLSPGSLLFQNSPQLSVQLGLLLELLLQRNLLESKKLKRKQSKRNQRRKKLRLKLRLMMTSTHSPMIWTRKSLHKWSA